MSPVVTLTLVALYSASWGLSGEVQSFTDTMPDTWVASDSLMRTLPGFKECGPPRTDRTVGMFYFLWLGAHVNGGPHDISRILAKDPNASMNKDNPLWGPMHAMHHWGESVFGYYNTDDPYVLRKHAQMLADAGVDVILFDVTNQVTYRNNYIALLRAFADVRAKGGRTPQVAFLCPFGAPAGVVEELYRDLYAPGLHSDLWFRWEGKPLILADPDMLRTDETYGKHDGPAKLSPGHTLGQTFSTTYTVDSVEACCPTWGTKDSALTLTLFREGPGGERLLSRRFTNVRDNAWLGLRPDSPLPPGTYYLVASEPQGTIGWWSHSQDVFPRGRAFADEQPVAGDRTIRLSSWSDRSLQLRGFFTFRRPQPDYFKGQTKPDMWSWLEVYPQHVFMNSRGQKEQMSVGVAQNAVGNRLGSMSEAGSRGRSYHDGTTDTRPGAINRGFNFAEQFERALKEDPRFVFITGWNEWIAMRFDEFAGVKNPVMFVDTFDQEHSRDIEPMRGGHGDAYYYQLVSYVRRYKGVRPPPKASAPTGIKLNSDFGQWADVAPTYRDDAGDIASRDWPGYNNHTRYRNATGRNDLVLAKVARDDRFLYFYVRTDKPITPPTGEKWMLLFINADGDPRTGWEGYDVVVNRLRRGSTAGVVERYAGGWKWQPVSEAAWVMAGNELHLAVPRGPLCMDKGPLRFDFKWADNAGDGDISSFITDGDVAPNGRFNYHFEE